jgi:hypothetical protein
VGAAVYDADAGGDYDGHLH